MERNVTGEINAKDDDICCYFYSEDKLDEKYSYIVPESFEEVRVLSSPDNYDNVVYSCRKCGNLVLRSEHTQTYYADAHSRGVKIITRYVPIKSLKEIDKLESVKPFKIRDDYRNQVILESIGME